ncbi:MAG: SDR family oxidoreductase [Actinomycetales bacterium]|jgi:retinol dehydrogenase-14|uniref:SDR family oxidoreductase n=1 Tax=Candidatus Phosphoribacter hodrii TaxID=2953743 RepID=A0A9D7TCF9_9MICO|nr:SDR family oxidoreductase [Candidatus Phosphoribacter hodrii]
MTSNLPMSGQTALVTGATGGIGLATAVALAGLGARVGVVGRDEKRTAAAVQAVLAVPGSGGADGFLADFSDQREVRALAAEVLAAYPRLDVLVNNAGGYWSDRHVSADGLEWTFAVNHLAPFLLTSLLEERLRESAPARIVTVASDAHRAGRIEFDDLQAERGYAGMRAYAQSKLANILFTRELARRLSGSGVAAYSVHPGTVRTGFAREDAGRLFGLVLRAGALLMKSPEQGAQTSVYAASSPELVGRTGEYLAKSRVAKPSARAQDDVAAARLWSVSEDLVAGSA